MIKENEGMWENIEPIEKRVPNLQSYRAAGMQVCEHTMLSIQPSAD